MNRMETFQVLTWEAGDDESSEQYIIHMFGRNEEGAGVHVRVKYYPCFYVKVKNPPKHPKEIKREQITNCKSVWGYSTEPQTFTKLVFKTLEDRRWAENFYKKVLGKHLIFEANIDPVLRFMHRTGIQSTGWAQAPIQDKPIAWTEVKPIAEKTSIAPIRITSFDIECFSEDASFPDPEKDSDCVFQIAMSTVTWGHSDKPPEEKLLCISDFGTERELLEAFARELRACDPDILTGWNIFGFDLEYLQKRLVKNKCSPQAYKWGRGFSVQDLPAVAIREKRLASNALGSNLLKMVPMFGRYVFDLFQEVKREQKYERYTLNHVSQVLLGDRKLDMPVKEIFKRFRDWRSGDDREALRSVGEYCMKDTLLPHRIMERLCTIPNLLEMAKATWVPVSWLSERGQQIKVFSQISKKAAELNFMIPTLYKVYGEESTDKYKGATVLDADTGAYYTPVTALDFASLYPSIMMAHNLCYSTIILGQEPPEGAEKVGDSWYMQDIPALLPEVLKELKQFRKQAKKDMAAAKGTPMEDVYNAKQLAYKISMNSVYGFTGASNGFLPMVEIASSVTFKGREMIQMTKELVEREFPGSKVRYGDSVMPWTPVIVKYLGFVFVKSIEDLSVSNSWKPYPGFMKDGTNKEQADLVNMKTWTHIGWQTIRRVIRHLSVKKIWRVSTNTGLVDVTDDHSLIREDGTLVKPGELKVGDKLLHSLPHIDMSRFIKKSDGVTGQVKAQSDILLKGGQLSDECFVTCVEVFCESWEGYVYDLETDAGTFQAGVGNMIVKNTDSVMVEFDVGGLTGQDAIKRSWELGELASQKASEILRKPNELELEKVYCPYFLYSKKRYAARKWVLEDGELESTTDVKGLQVVRRDTCPFVRRVCKELLDMILNGDCDPRPIVEYVHHQKNLLLTGQIPLEELVLTRNLAAEYKSQNLAHVKVRDKIKERTPGSEPKSGDRVPFVLVKNTSKKAFEKAEDPEYVREHNIELDYQHYYKNLFKKPVADLLAPIIDGSAL